MHSVTVKITCDCLVGDTSAAGLSDLLYGIDDGQVDGSVEVVEGPSEVVCPFEAIRNRLLAVLDVRPKAIVPVLAEKILLADANIWPNMTNTEMLQVKDILRDCAAIAAQYSRNDIATELECICHTLKDHHVG